jgi:regulatory protein
MVITQIVKVSNSKFKIYLDQEYAFTLYIGELRRYHMTENEDLPREIYEKLTGEILPKRAKQRCLHRLEARDYTERELRDKLIQGGYPRECIDTAIAYVASYGYLDDLRYAQRYITTYSEQRSRRLIEQQLLRKGITKDILEQAYPPEAPGSNREAEASMIRHILEKKRYNPETADDKEKRRLYAMLMRKGFEPFAITDALRLPT